MYPPHIPEGKSTTATTTMHIHTMHLKESPSFNITSTLHYGRKSTALVGKIPAWSEKYRHNINLLNTAVSKVPLRSVKYRTGRKSIGLVSYQTTSIHIHAHTTVCLQCICLQCIYIPSHVQYVYHDLYATLHIHMPTMYD